MYNDIIIKLLQKKSSLYLKISITLFLLSLMLLSTIIGFSINQYEQISTDFINNKNVHFIEINSYGNVGAIRPLNTKDKNTIVKSINQKFKAEDFVAFNEYMINFGINNNSNTPIFFSSIDEEGEMFTGIEKLQKNVIYTTKKFELDKINLEIPKIVVAENGFESNKVEEVTFDLHTSTIKNKFMDRGIDKYYISKNTFFNVIEKIYSIDKIDFINRFNNGEDFGVQFINKIYVYVDNISNVEDVANILDNENYNINYVLSAFNDMGGTINKSILIMLFCVGLFILVTSINVLISLYIYFKSIQRDIGILKAYGYKSNICHGIMNDLLKKIIIRVVITSSVYSLLITAFLLKDQSVWSTIIVFVIPLILTVFIVIRTIIYKISKENTINLLHN